MRKSLSKGSSEVLKFHDSFEDMAKNTMKLSLKQLKQAKRNLLNQCGIAGIFDFKRESNLQAKIDLMLDTMRSRGPDDRKVYCRLLGLWNATFINR